MHDGNGLACDDVGERLSRPDGRELVDIADEDDGGIIRHGLQKGVHQENIDHRGLIDHEQLAIERILLVALEAAVPRIDLKQPVDGLGLQARRVGHAFRRASGRSTKEEVYALSGQDPQDHVHRRPGRR
jgi:hypothetical protein